MVDRLSRVIIITAICAFSAQFGVTVIATPLAWWVVEEFETTWFVSSLIFSAFTIASTPLEIPGGILSDRIGRRPLIVGGLLLYAGASVLFPFARVASDLIFTRLLQGAGAGIFFPAITALITETTSYENRGHAMSIYNIGVGAGMALGPAVGGLLFTRYNIFMPFFLCAGFALVSVILVSLLVPEPGHKAIDRAKLQVTGGNRSAIMASCIIIFFGIGVAAIMTPVFAPFAAKELMGSLSLPERLEIIGYILSAMLAVFTILQMLFSKLMKHVGELNLSLLGLFLCGSGMLALYFATAPVELFMISAVLGAGLGALSLGTLTLASKSAKTEEGKVMGIYYTLFYAGLGAIPLFCGWLSDVSGPRILFLGYAMLLFVLCVVIWIYALFRPIFRSI